MVLEIKKGTRNIKKLKDIFSGHLKKYNFYNNYSSSLSFSLSLFFFAKKLKFNRAPKGTHTSYDCLMA